MCFIPLFFLLVACPKPPPSAPVTPAPEAPMEEPDEISVPPVAEERVAIQIPAMPEGSPGDRVTLELDRPTEGFAKTLSVTEVAMVTGDVVAMRMEIETRGNIEFSALEDGLVYTQIGGSTYSSQSPPVPGQDLQNRLFSAISAAPIRLILAPGGEGFQPHDVEETRTQVSSNIQGVPVEMDPEMAQAMHDEILQSYTQEGDMYANLSRELDEQFEPLALGSLAVGDTTDTGPFPNGSTRTWTFDGWAPCAASVETTCARLSSVLHATDERIDVETAELSASYGAGLAQQLGQADPIEPNERNYVSTGTVLLDPSTGHVWQQAKRVEAVVTFFIGKQALAFITSTESEVAHDWTP